MKVLRKGDRGEDVKILQRKLNLQVDGIFGPVTEEAVVKFQLENNIIADGIVGTSTWNKLNSIVKPKRTVNLIVLHCSATPEGKDFTTDQIKKWHLLRGFSDIGYHYVIYRDGSINKGRDESVVGAHCANYNAHSIGICYIGGCDITGRKALDTRTDNQKQSMYRLVDELLKKYNLTIDNVKCHNLYANKACPSFKIADFKNEYLKWKKTRT